VTGWDGHIEEFLAIKYAHVYILVISVYPFGQENHISPLSLAPGIMDRLGAYMN
jgi:hypothetical protein